MPKDFSPLRRRATLALVIAGGIFIAVAVFDLAAHPASQGALRTYKEYVLTATIFPAVAAIIWALLSLHGLHADRDERGGRIGLRVAIAGLLALAVDAIVTIASASTDTTGPLYPLAILTTVIGVGLLAIHWYRAGVLPRWIGPTIALGWFLGATPILGSGGFLIVGAAFVAVAVGLGRQTTTRHRTAPAGNETSLTA
jgi:hypothetical protein